MSMKGNLKRETESLQIAAQNNTVRAIQNQEYIKRKKIANVDYLVIEMKGLIKS